MKTTNQTKTNIAWVRVSDGKRVSTNPIANLSFKILEYKTMYYTPDVVHPDWHRELTISDAEYDKLEYLYKQLSGVTAIVDAPTGETPSGRLILSRLGMSKKSLALHTARLHYEEIAGVWEEEEEEEEEDEKN